MKRRTIWIAITAAACLIGAVGGHKIGRNSVEVIEPQTARDSSPGGGATSDEPQRKLVNVSPADLVSEYLDAIATRDKEAARALEKKIASMSKEDLPEALAAAEQIARASNRSHLLLPLLDRLAQLDPQAAIDYLVKKVEQGDQQLFAPSVFRNIAARFGGEKAFELYQRYGFHSKGHLGVLCVHSIFNLWSLDDLDGALAATSQVEGHDHRRQMISTIINVANDPVAREKLQPWVLTLENEDERYRATQSLASIWANRDPEAVLTWARESGLDSVGMSGIEHGIAKSKISNDPHAAAEWLMARATEESRSGHLSFIVMKWADRAPNAAGQWLSEQNLDAGADVAIARFAETIMYEDPESAYQWARTITEESSRERTIEEVMRVWDEQDPTAAAQARESE